MNAKTKTSNKATIAAAVDTNKETITAAVSTPQVALVQRGADSKAAKANGIFKTMFAMSPVPARKDMIAAVVKEADLTPKGAATYLQNFKSKNGLVQKKAAPAEATPAIA